MNQSSALRQLKIILDEAMNNGVVDQPSGPILLRAMQIECRPKNLINFSMLLYKAKEEAKRLRTYPGIDEYVLIIEELQNQFIENCGWLHAWKIFGNHIQISNISQILNSLSVAYHTQNLKPSLEEDFLIEIDKEFTSLLSEVLNSTISRNLKLNIVSKIEDILSAIRNYLIDGAEGLEKAVQSLLIDLEVENHNFSSEDKINPTIKKIKGIVFSLVICLRPSFWDIIGVIPDINGFGNLNFMS